MIIIKNGEKQIYHPKNPKLKLVNPRLKMEDNAAGSLTFKIYDSNLNYGTIKKLFPVISVVRDGKTIFKGRTVTDKKDFHNGKTVEVEGKLAFFNDSYIEPFEFSGTPLELFRMIVENHNSQVQEWQQFKVGIVTVKDNNDYIVRSSEKMLNTWKALKEKCFNSSIGGHIRIRYETDGDYVDWLEDYEQVSAQSIQFAKNLIDLSMEMDATETYTAIRPIGAEVDGVKIDISSVNGGKKYLVNEEKAAEYGIIYAPEDEATWDDVTLPANLLSKAKEKLYGSFAKLNETYEIKAVDLNLTDAKIEALNICEYVPVVSKPHGIKGNYLLNKADIAIADPQNSVFYLGASRRTLSDMNLGTGEAVTVPKDVSAFQNDANYVSQEQVSKVLSDYPKTEEVEVIVSQAVGQIPSGTDGKSAYELAVENGYEGTEEEWLASLKGEPGETGTAGEPGKDGANGADGVDGESAYEIAVSNGFEGTEEEWLLSLKGEKGDAGEKGESGDKGDTGENGADGVSISSVEQTTISSEDGGVNIITVTLSNGETATFAVKNGSKGSTGEKGEQGEPGEMVSHVHRTEVLHPMALEMTPSSESAGHGGYIDFHFNKATDDYTVRLIEQALGTLMLYGHLAISKTLCAGNGNSINGNYYSAAVGGAGNAASGSWSATVGGGSNTASGSRSATVAGFNIKATGENSVALGGFQNIAANYGSIALGKYNKAMTTGASQYATAGDVLAIGNGSGTSARANAFRVTYAGEVYGLSAFNSSGADYAEFVKPWYDGNPNKEDRVGYFVTVKDGLLYKANDGDFIIGITSGNPSIVGNSDEDYYWKYERDEFNRIIYEDVEEEVEVIDEDGNVVEVTKKIIKNGRPKISAEWDSELQNSYIERKNRPEWSYVGMVGILPVRDDGTCQVGSLCKCGNDGIATIATEKSVDTFLVIERKSENVVVIVK